MKFKVITIIGLALFCAVIVAPPLIHGYVYPNVGDDSAGYLAIFDSMKRGIISPSMQYLGEYFVGYPLAFMSKMTGANLDSLFLWFNYISLVLTGIVLYFVGSKLAGRLAGWFSLLIVLFGAQGLMFQFYYGQIFNLINVGLVFPLLILSVVMYLEKGGKIRLAITLFLVLLFSSFHTSGIYLPVIAGLTVLGYAAYVLILKRKPQKHVLVLGGSIIGLSIMGFVVLVVLPTFNMMSRYFENPFGAVLLGIQNALAVPIGDYFMSIVSMPVLALTALVFVYIKDIFTQQKIILAILGVPVVVLGVASFARVSSDPWRQALDLATVLALFVAVALGILLRRNKNWVLIGIIIMGIGFGLFHNLSTWFSYNSAIRPADLQALEYADNFKTYSVSGTIAPWVYGRFTSAEWIGNEGQIVIVRDKPMTPRSTEGNIWYQSHGWTPDNSYEMTKIFSDSEVTVLVYERKLEHR